MPGPIHVERTRVAWVDTDAGGRIHFTAAFRWAEAAETGLGRSLGLLQDWGDLPRRAVRGVRLEYPPRRRYLRPRPPHRGACRRGWTAGSAPGDDAARALAALA